MGLEWSFNSVPPWHQFSELAQKTSGGFSFNWTAVTGQSFQPQHLSRILGVRSKPILSSRFTARISRVRQEI